MKFISHGYDGGYLSVVVIEHLNKRFVGYARLHPDDEDRASEIIGGKYAEIRATIKALKYERKLEKEKCEECRKFVRACEQYKGFDKSSPTARAMYRQLNRHIKRVNEIAEVINNLMSTLEEDIKIRDIIVNKIHEKDKKD